MTSRLWSWILLGFAAITAVGAWLYASWGLARSADNYRHVPHDADASFVGIGLFGLLLGSVLSIASLFPAITSYRRSEPARPLLRRVELAAFVLSAAIGIAVFLMIARTWY